MKNPLRATSWNVGTMSRRQGEIFEVLSRRRVDVCCVQEMRWKDGSQRKVIEKRERYNFFWSGGETGTGEVGVFLAERWI